MKASPARILLGLVLGVTLGYLCVKSRSPMLARIPGIVAPVGTLFISAIQVCVIPLVASSLIVGCETTHLHRRMKPGFVSSRVAHSSQPCLEWAKSREAGIPARIIPKAMEMTIKGRSAPSAAALKIL